MPDPTDAGALAGLKILDLSRVLAGPFCTQWLADHGAEVVKVEPPRGDETRTWGPPFQGDAASYFLGINRNKRDIALDIATDEGREIVLRLLAQSDAVIENFKPGTLERWGLGYEDVLQARFPRLIHCRVTGFGADGPLGGLPGYDAVIQAVSGIMAVNGTTETGALRVGMPLVDLASGLAAASAILMAVIERQRSGLGQFVEVSLFDTAVSLLYPHSANWFLNGKEPQRRGSAHPNVAPYDKFPTATGEIFLGVGNDGQFARLCAELGRPELAEDPAYATNGARNAHREALRAELAPLLAAADGEALCRRLAARGVPAGPVLTLGEALRHAHTRHRDMVVREGDYRATGIPLKFSRTPGAVRTPPPAFGADARAILREAGFSDAEIERFRAAGAVLEQRRRQG